jgi:Flp pilus assembly protein TadG
MKLNKQHLLPFTLGTRGAVLPLIGLSIGLLIIFMGVAVDSGRYFLVRNKLQSALDAAVLAAADIATERLQKEDPQAITKRAQEFFAANFPDKYLGTTINKKDMDITFDAKTGTVSGTVDATLPLVFGGVRDLSGNSLGPSLDMEVFSEVVRALGKRTLEIAIVVDQSVSMCFKLGTGKAWGVPRKDDFGNGCPKFALVQQQINNFVGIIQNSLESSNSANGAAYYSYIPYTHSVRIDGSKRNYNFFFPTVIDKIQSAKGLTSDAKNILARVNATEVPTEGGTNTAMGLWWGWASLRDDPASKSLFTGSSKHDDPANHPASLASVRALETVKIMVLLTDGENEYPNRERSSPTYPIVSGDNEGFTSDTNATNRVADLANRIKAEEIKLCAISFNVPTTSPIVGQLSSAADPDCYFTAQDSDELGKAFDEIANSLIDKVITK